MKTTPVLAAAVIAVLVLMATACGGSTAPSGPQPTAGPTVSGGGGGGASPTAVPATAGAKAAPTAAAKPATSGGSGGGELEKVSMPSGPAYDPYKPVKIGDVVDLPKSAMILQVTGAKTVDYDAQKDLLLVDLVLGNKGKEEAPISSVLMMGALTSDWRQYSLAMDDLMQVAPKISALNIRTFDVGLKPGEARKGTAVIPVPKDAKGLGYFLQPANFAANTSDPTVYVGLSIKGDFAFPIIPENADALKAGTVYKVGQAVKAPKRGVAIQVNGARERTQSLPKVTINVANKLVIVDITTRLFGTATDVLSKELRLVDSTGKYFGDSGGNSNLILQAENGMAYMSDYRRGHIVFSGPRDAKGLKLVFTPSNDEKIEFDLGTLAQSTSAPSSETTTAPGKTATGPKLVDASVLPAEIKAIPLPAGFGVVEGSVNRSAPGGTFESADAQLSGKMTIKDLSSFYKMRLGAQWDLLDESVTAAELQLNFFNRKDDSLNLYINAEETDRGTTVDLRIEKS